MKACFKSAKAWRGVTKVPDAPEKLLMLRNTDATLRMRITPHIKSRRRQRPKFLTHLSSTINSQNHCKNASLVIVIAFLLFCDGKPAISDKKFGRMHHSIDFIRKGVNDSRPKCAGLAVITTKKFLLTESHSQIFGFMSTTNPSNSYQNIELKDNPSFP